MNRRLYRCRYDRRIAGVAGGVAEYFDLDPTLVRVVWFVSIFFGGFTLAVYLGLWLIMPLEPELAHGLAPSATQPPLPPEAHRHAAHGSARVSLFVGWALLLFGVLALADVLLPSMLSWRHLWPVFFVGLGAWLIFGTMRRDADRGEPQAPDTGTPSGVSPTSPTEASAAE